MVFPLQDKYIDLLTDFGFKRVFGTEPNKALLIDFLNTLLPDHHHIQDVTFKNPEFFGNTLVDRKAIFDVYCQAVTGERFIVEIQKAKQNFFKDRSVYYSTFPIQEQAQKGTWNYELAAVYTVGVLDFIFDDHRHEDTLIHTVQLKNQRCEVFYDKLTFIYIELPKFTKTLDDLETHADKWLFLLRHLAELEEPPTDLQEGVFSQLFEVAEIANFSPAEQVVYQDSLKYYRDMHSITETLLQEGRQEGLQQGLQQGRQEGRQEEGAALILRQLNRRVGSLSAVVQAQVMALPLALLEDLGEALLDFEGLSDLLTWLDEHPF